MPEPEFMFKVEDTFTISGRGVCLIGLRYTQLGRLGKGDAVELKRPDGTCIRSEVAGVEWRATYAEPRPPMEERRFPVLLSPPLSKADIPIGTEVWLVEKGPRPVEPNGAQRTRPPGFLKQVWRSIRESR